MSGFLWGQASLLRFLCFFRIGPQARSFFADPPFRSLPIPKAAASIRILYAAFLQKSNRSENTRIHPYGAESRRFSTSERSLSKNRRISFRTEKRLTKGLFLLIQAYSGLRKNIFRPENTRIHPSQPESMRIYPCERGIRFDSPSFMNGAPASCNKNLIYYGKVAVLHICGFIQSCSTSSVFILNVCGYVQSETENMRIHPVQDSSPKSAVPR